MSERVRTTQATPEALRVALDDAEAREATALHEYRRAVRHVERLRAGLEMVVPMCVHCGAHVSHPECVNCRRVLGEGEVAPDATAATPKATYRMRGRVRGDGTP
jgi:hypothetical protein